jgi:hypothetical protein
MPSNEQQMKLCIKLYPQTANGNNLKIGESRLVDKIVEKPNDDLRNL